MREAVNHDILVRLTK